MDQLIGFPEKKLSTDFASLTSSATPSLIDATPSGQQSGPTRESHFLPQHAFGALSSLGAQLPTVLPLPCVI